ncbi:nucleolin [Amborella trichopoda]|uniref:Calmodulin-binding domain-containing protein n=1 Tax=Amborella trichopoda TaxID=13333 RepID=W1NF81_AMBTC|nr:nucleolin [Amborella trichopoda]ERM94472.1 hypothetical protein AMTR_s00010p00260870 [Amborella trichopoda]|eukprot:XP_020519748.1 nucleolin [Amborella trichopoda]
MAAQSKEKSISSPSTPHKSDAPPRRRRIPSLRGLLESEIISEKSISRYLKSSTSSCHDYCKYGRKQESEAKEKKKPSLSRKLPLKSPSPSPSLFTKTCKSECSRDRPATKTKTTSPSSNTAAFAKPVTTKFPLQSPKSGNSSKPVKRVEKEGRESATNLSSSTVESACKVEDEAKTTNSIEPEDDIVKVIEVVEDHDGNHGNEDHGHDDGERCNVDGDGDTILPIDCEPKTPEQESPETYTIKDPLSEEQEGIQTQKTGADHSDAEDKEHDAPIDAANAVSVDDDVDDEDEDSDDAEYEEDDYTDDSYEEEENGSERKKNEGIERRIDGGEEGCFSRKPCFQRGTVVVPESSDDKPRKLRFRRGRTIGNEEINKNLGRRRYKKREVPAKNGDGADQRGKEVVLNKGSIQGKKDALVFNEVIEETASKLVEKRKSKVKALVGAFETVISLQGEGPNKDDNDNDKNKEEN